MQLPGQTATGRFGPEPDPSDEPPHDRVGRPAENSGTKSSALDFQKPGFYKPGISNARQ